MLNMEVLELVNIYPIDKYIFIVYHVVLMVDLLALVVTNIA